MKNTLIASALVLALANTAAAENLNDQELEVSTHGWVFGVGEAQIDKQTAFEERVGSSATYIQAGWQGQKNHLVFGAGLSIYMFNDKDSFSQDVENGWGDVSRESSSADGYGLYGELGYSWMIKPQTIHLDLMGGLEMIWAERSIANCSDCYSEDIDVDSGLYVKPSMKFIAENGFFFNIAYTQYLSADFNSRINLAIGMDY